MHKNSLSNKQTASPQSMIVKNTNYFNISDIISEKIKLSNQYFENINK